MSDCAEAASATAPHNPQTDARAARLAKFEREQVIVDSLNRGVSVAEIAARIDVSEKRMRAIIREILARRMPAPPEEFVAIQVSRLNEALLVAYSAMTDANLKAVDRVVRIVRELDRYHGFCAASRRSPEPSRLEAPVQGTLAFGAALVCRPEFAPQDAETLESAPDRIDLVPTPGLDPGTSKDAPDRTNVAGRWSRLRDATPCVAPDAPQHEAQGFAIAASARDDRPGFPSQDLEKIDSAPGIAPAPEAEFPVVHDASTGNRARPYGDEPTAPNGRRESPLQDIENVESAPGKSCPAEASSSGGASNLGPNPIGFRPLKLRMTLNGVMAC